MLTADLVRLRKRAGVLSVTELKGKTKTRALELAGLYLELAREQQGSTYESLRAAWSSVTVAAREKKLSGGLIKLIEDDCEVSAQSPMDPRQLRSEVFLRASEARRMATPERPWRRQDVLQAVAESHGVDSSGLDDALYSDLRAQHKVQRVSALTAEQLVERYRMAQYQAVLLRAVHVTAKVWFDSASDYRQLFRSLKFRRLLHSIHPITTAAPSAGPAAGDGGYRIEMDGPFSLFESVTKYGLQLALVFPALCQARKLELKAELRWGKTRERLRFEYSQSTAPESGEVDSRLPDEVESLVRALGEVGASWTVQPNVDVLDLPGVGVIVPDLVFTKDNEKVYLEVMGFWSRDAVWKRVELVQAGLPHKILFAVSSRLRVSEEVLDEDETGALYVYKGVMSPKAVLRHVAALAAR